MITDNILWTQKAHSKQNNYKHLGYFLYEVIGGRFTLLAFTGMFSLVGYKVDYFGQFLSISIGLLLYYLISDAFKIFMTGINLEYFVTNKAIHFSWGLYNTKQLSIPFEEITKISVQYGINEKRSAIIFKNVDGFTNKDFGFSKERYFKDLSFENVVDIESLIAILHQLHSKEIERVVPTEYTPWEDRLPSSTAYLKIIQLIAVAFFYFSSNMALKIIDAHMLHNEVITDVIISQKFIGKKECGITNQLVTKANYTINLAADHQYQYNYLNEVVVFSVSPMFKKITSFNSFKSKKYEHLLDTGRSSASALFKLFAIVTMLFSCYYIFYKRGIVPFSELSLIVLGPLFFLICSLFLFT